MTISSSPRSLRAAIHPRRLDPRYLLHRLATRAYEHVHADEPWISQGAVRFCEAHLTDDMTGFEWGSGRSTVWFGRRLKSLISIEHDPTWQVVINGWLAAASLDQVRCLLVPLDHDPNEPTRTNYAVTPAYVAAIARVPDASLDFVAVDGHYRQACVLAAFPKIKPAGLLLVDDTSWLPSSEWHVPHDWTLVHHSADRWREKSTSVWQKRGLGR